MATNIKAITSCMGYRQLTSLSSATNIPSITTDPVTGLTIKPNFVLIVPEGQAVRWRDDGVDPSASVGMPLAVGVTLQYDGDLSKIKFIQQVSGGIINISYYV